MCVTRHLLSLIAGLLLVPPTGWCCLFTVTLPATAPAVTPASECCSSCCPRPAQPGEEAPSRAPMTVCCCENNVPLPDDGPAKAMPDDGFSTTAVAAISPSTDHFPTRPAALCLSPPRPLQLLQCRWLC